MKNKKILVLVIAIFFVFCLNVVCFANNTTEKEITNDFVISSFSSINNVCEYGVYVNTGNENDELISIKAADYNLPKNLYNYKDDIRLRIKYSSTDKNVLDCKVVNYQTDKIIEDLSEENIDKLFNIEYGKKVIENKWVDVIKLSELKENEVYNYKATSTVDFPKIENNLEHNCIIYIKEHGDETYTKQINTYKKISSSSLSLEIHEYDAGDSFRIMYKKVKNDELLKMIPESEIIRLSDYKNNDELKYKFEKYIYNDTEKDITINTKTEVFGNEKTATYTIKKDEIQGFDWMIDSAIISSSENTDNDENKKTENTKNENVQEEQNKNDVKAENVKNETTKEETEKKESVSQKSNSNSNKENISIKEEKNNNKIDNTQISGKIPQTGEETKAFFIICIAAISAVIGYKKTSEYKDIK